MEQIFNKILKVKPATLTIILILLPFIAIIIAIVTTIIEMFTDYEFVFPLFSATLAILSAIYLNWVWAVVFYIEEKVITDKLYFKISYGIIFSYSILMFLKNLGLEITKRQFLLENTTWTIIGSIVGLYLMIVMLSYIYISYFIAKKLTHLRLNNPMEDFVYFIALFFFPIGIPFIQAKLLRQKSVLEVIKK